MLTKVMVYGSLKAGRGNHYLLEGSKYLGPAKTSPIFTMVSYGSFPAVLADGDTAITGEIYEVDDNTLRALDRLEGHPDWYRRCEVVTDVAKAWMYIMNPEKVHARAPIVETGVW